MMTMRITQTIALAFVAACASAAVAPLAIASPDVRVFQCADDGAITEGETMLAADPDVAYRAVIDYPRWPDMFPDIRHVIITNQSAGHDRVTFVHADGNRDNVHFHNRPATRTVWFEDTGGRAEVWVEIAFLAGDRPGTTRLHSRLYADVHGFASLFVSDSKIRNLREQRVRDDLSHLRAYFARAIVRAVEAQLHPERGPATAGSM